MSQFIADPQIQAEVDRVTELLRAMSIGETAAYDDLHTNRYVIDRARASVEKYYGIRFGTVRNVGVKRLAAHEVPDIGIDGVKRVHRAGKKTLARLSNLRAYNDMKPEDRLKIAAHRMIASHVVEKTTRSAIKQNEDSIRNAGSAIDFGNVLEK